MHKLQRGAEPGCLRNHRHGRDQWQNLEYHERIEIWNNIDTMQGMRCAYCEAEIENGRRHIDHFRQRSRFPQDTFRWNNLFGSCNRPANCASHKDKCGAYDPQDLIKPDIEDPERFFIFVYDGTIRVRSKLNANETRRAEETLRILNLNADNGPLRHMRKRATAGYLQTAEEIRRLAEEYPLECQSLLLAEIEATTHQPFATAIKHALIFLL